MKENQSVCEREQHIVGEMIALYCKKQHFSKDGLCTECSALRDYAAVRISKCPFGENKTFCSNCKIHCYKPDMRERIRSVMRFSGPRMIFHHPVMAVSHLIETKKQRKLVNENES